MTRWGVMVVVLVGCSARSPGQPPGAGSAKATAPAAAEDPVQSLVAKADQALADSMKLDYRLPFSNERVDRNPIRMTYFKACRAGDHRACWMTTNIAVHGHQRDAYDEVVSL